MFDYVLLLGCKPFVVPFSELHRVFTLVQQIIT